MNPDYLCADDVPGRAGEHPMEAVRRQAGAVSTFPGYNLTGFYNPQEKHGEPRLVFGDKEKFERDLIAYHARQERHRTQDWRWWIVKDLENING